MGDATTQKCSLYICVTWIINLSEVFVILTLIRVKKFLGNNIEHIWSLINLLLGTNLKYEENMFKDRATCNNNSKQFCLTAF